MSAARPNAPLRVAVLISGTGRHLQAFIDDAADGKLPIEIACVISSKAQAQGLARAERAGIPTQVISPKQYPQRADYDSALADALAKQKIDLLILAGFMRILTAEFVQCYAGRMLNIHPSLLPKYPGLNTHQRALDAGDTEHGASVHFVTAELDGGPVVIQARVPIQPGDNAEQLAARVFTRELDIYPQAVRWFAEQRLQLRDNRAWLDRQPLQLGMT